MQEGARRINKASRGDEEQAKGRQPAKDGGDAPRGIEEGAPRGEDGGVPLEALLVGGVHVEPGLMVVPCLLVQSAPGVVAGYAVVDGGGDSANEAHDLRRGCG